ncbi:MAG: hypothetical protein QOK15_1417 [Nocardioidaceae bacterium]|nr:hypothetical protein [Nocardioidaceae bacterium]
MSTTTRPIAAAAATPAKLSPRAANRAARLTGILFLVTYATSIPAVPLYAGLNDPDFVLGAGSVGPVQLGAFLEVILIAANIGTAVALWPVLRRPFPALSLGFVGARIIESAFIGAGVLTVLAQVTMRDNPAGASNATLSAVGASLEALHDWTFALGPGVVVGVGNGMLLGYMLYRSGLVPRGMAMLGIVGGPLLVLSGTAVIFGLYEQVTPVALVASLPEFVWELSLGIYLTVKGFRSSSLTSPQGASA